MLQPVQTSNGMFGALYCWQAQVADSISRRAIAARRRMSSNNGNKISLTSHKRSVKRDKIAKDSILLIKVHSEYLINFTCNLL